MQTTKTSTSSTPRTPSEYEKLLLTAQAAQTAAERSVADLAALKRSLHEAPRQLELRRDELARAQQALEAAESEYEQNRTILSQRQAEAARLIEAAAAAQQALAQALINDDSLMVEQQDEVAKLMAQYRQAGSSLLTEPRPAQSAKPATAAGASNAARSAASPLTPAIPLRPDTQPADQFAELVFYLAERDVLCPSCGHNLRGSREQRCPDCRLLLTAPALRTVRPNFQAALPWLWVVRVICVLASLICGYLTMNFLFEKLPILCGGGSQCDTVFRSSWSYVLGIPVTLPAIPLYVALFVATFFVNVGNRDTIRRRGWMAISFLGLFIGVVSLWLLIVQAAILQAFCPHCAIADLMGVIIGILVLVNAPLRKPEFRPAKAAGHINLAGRRAGTIVALVLAISGGMAALQVAANSIKSAGEQAKDDAKSTDEKDELLFKPLRQANSPKQANPAGSPLIARPAPSDPTGTPDSTAPAPTPKPADPPAAKPDTPAPKPDANPSKKEEDLPSFQLKPVK